VLDIGKKGEEIALEYLLSKGNYSFIAKNWRKGRYEIDIIVESSGTIIFVEVKTRANNLFGPPELAYDHRKQEHIFKAAERYLETEAKNLAAIRFDLIAIVLNQHDLQEIVHFEDIYC